VGFVDWILGREAAPTTRDDADPASMVGFPTGGGNGVLPYGVSPTTAAGLPAVHRALNVLATGVSQLPWREHRGTLDLPLSRICRQPVSFYTRREWVIQVVKTLALYQVCYLYKLEPYDNEGIASGYWPVPPQIIIPRAVDTYALVPPKTYVLGRTTIDADQLVILRTGLLPGVPDYMSFLLDLARQEFAGMISAHNYAARYWQAGGSPSTVLETDANLSDGQAVGLGNRWAQRRQMGPDHPAVLSNGLKARPYGADLAGQSAVEVMRDMNATVGRYFGIPPRLMNAPSLDSQTYKTSQEENIDLLHYTLANYIGAVEDAISGELPGSREMSMVTSGLTEGTQLIRYQSYQLATGAAAWMTPAEAREAEGLPPVESLPEGMASDSQQPAVLEPMRPDQVVIAATTGRPTT